MASLVLKPMILTQYLISDLIAVSISFRNVILINLYGIFWSSTIICHGLSIPQRKKSQSARLKYLSFPSPQRKCSPLKIILSFLLLITHLPHSSSYNNLLFYTTLRASSSCQMGYCPIHESHNIANQMFTFTWLTCFLTNRFQITEIKVF